MLCISGFEDAIMCAHNRPRKGDTNRAYPQCDSLGGSIGAVSDVYDYFVL